MQTIFPVYAVNILQRSKTLTEWHKKKAFSFLDGTAGSGLSIMAETAIGLSLPIDSFKKGVSPMYGESEPQKSVGLAHADHFCALIHKTADLFG